MKARRGAGGLPKVICRGLYSPASKVSQILTSLFYQNSILLFLEVIPQFIETTVLDETICLTQSSLKALVVYYIIVTIVIIMYVI